MIPANELRIGNWVILEMYGEPAQINSIKQRKGGYAVHFDSSLSYMESDIFPITLTPDVLEAAGFKKHESLTYHYHYRLFNQTDTKGCLQQSKISLGRGGTEVFINHRWLCGVTHLHQLQNLHFAITGEELTICGETLRLL